MDETFVQLCDGVNIPAGIRIEAWELWSTVRPELPDMIDRNAKKAGYYCCCVYITSVDSGCLPSISVSSLVQSAGIHVMTFFACMRHLREARSLNSRVLQKFMGLEKRYCVSLALFHKLDQLLKSAFHDDEIPLNAPDDKAVISVMNAEGMEYRRSLAWLLYLHASNSINSGCELILAYHILICCLDAVIKLSPTFQLKPPYDELKYVKGDTSQEKGVLRQLCDPSLHHLDEVWSLQSDVIQPFLQSIQSGYLTFDVPQLEKLYLESYKASGGINELLFLSHDASVVPKNVSVATAAWSDDRESSVPITPIKAALSSVQSLRKLLASTPNQPSPTLQAYFDNCTENPSESIEKRVAQCKDKFVAAVKETLAKKLSHIGTHRYLQATRLYYRTLEAILVMEEERLCEKDFSVLLNKAEFHLSLLSCCVEIILTTYGISWNSSRQVMDSGESDFAFPWILNVFDLKAFYFYKVLETMIKAEPYLPKNIIRHLQGVENTILESIAWHEDSPLYELLSRSGPPHSTAAPVTPNLQNPTLPSATELYMSPVVNRYPKRTNSSSTSPLKGEHPSNSLTTSVSVPVSSGETTAASSRKSQSLTLFFNKVCRLGYHRLKALCSLLAIHKDLEHKIWTCLEHCITTKPELLKNRHLDQMMMCSVYALCKVVDMEIKFKVIVNAYKDLPHASMLTYREVYVSEGCIDSIIAFYNKVFSQVMKTFILQFSKTRGLSPTLSPVPKTLHSPSTSTYSLPGRPNFRVSPMKSPFKAPLHMTPRSRVLFCFGEDLGRGESSGQKLRQINASMAAVHSSSPHGSRISKRLRFDPPAQISSENVEMTLPVVTRTPVSPDKNKPKF